MIRNNKDIGILINTGSEITLTPEELPSLTGKKTFHFCGLFNTESGKSSTVLLETLPADHTVEIGDEVVITQRPGPYGKMFMVAGKPANASYDEIEQIYVKECRKYFAKLEQRERDVCGENGIIGIARNFARHIASEITGKYPPGYYSVPAPMPQRAP